MLFGLIFWLQNYVFTQCYTPKHAEQDQSDAKWLEKSLFSDVRVEEQVEA